MLLSGYWSLPWCNIWVLKKRQKDKILLFVGFLEMCTELLLVILNAVCCWMIYIRTTSSPVFRNVVGCPIDLTDAKKIVSSWNIRKYCYVLISRNGQNICNENIHVLHCTTASQRTLLEGNYHHHLITPVTVVRYPVAATEWSRSLTIWVEGVIHWFVIH